MSGRAEPSHDPDMANRWPTLGTGRSVEDVLAELEELRRDDVAWRDGRAFSLAYSAGPEVLDLAERAYRALSGENALNTGAFPSLRRMQNDVVDVVCGWLSAPAEAAGFMTSGGTESLILAVWAAVQRHRRLGRNLTSLNVVLPVSAHAALEKACTYFGVESRRTAVSSDWRADVDAISDALDDGTALVVASAPQYPQGVIDPVPSIAALAAERGISMHVDACMGGVVLPHLERSGCRVAPWDFRVEGVTSISVDLHKYGYSSKGAGVIVHRTKERRGDQTFVTDNWLGGLYGSSGILGTKSGGPIASAWAVMRHLGDEGYRRLAVETRRMTERIGAFVHDHSLLEIRGEPDSTLLCIGVVGDDEVPLDESRAGGVARRLRTGGWYVDVQGPPPSLHLTVNAVHGAVIERFLADLDAAVEAVATEAPGAGGPAGPSRGEEESSYGSVE